MGQSLDVLISGAGLVGGALACALAKTGLRVGLVDVRDPGLATSQDDRSFAISYGSSLQLRAWGIWEHLRGPLSPIQKIRVTQYKGGSGLTYEAEALGYEALGFMVPSQDLHRAVWETVQTFPVTHYIPQKVSSWAVGATSVSVTLASGEKLTTKLLVGAEGRQSALRESLGGATWRHTYDQAALVFTIAHSETHGQTAFEHFTSEGPLAFLPLTENRSAVVWSLKKEIAENLAGHPDILLQALFQHFGWGLGDLRLVSEIHFYPLSLIMPFKTWGDRLVLVGDAAHVLHPVAGQGLNVGMRDVAALAKSLGEARQLGLDIGNATLLKEWAALRRFDQWSMAALTHGVVGILGCEMGPLRKICDAGFWAVTHCAPLRKKLMLHAMGLSSVSE